MEWLESLSAIAAGLVLRIGLPALVTLLAALGLRRLDAHWQLESEKLRQRANALGADARQVRCWESKDCTPEQRAGCPAFAMPHTPCWQVFRQVDGRLPEACATCHVFRDMPITAAA
jgi:hypothetical protein